MMIYWNSESYLLATGLSLKTISKILQSSASEADIVFHLKKLGVNYLQRYQTIKEYYSLSKQGLQKLPIIVLLAGIPGTGKSAISKELSTAFGISSVYGGDILRSALRSALPKQGNEEFFTSIYDSWKFFGEYTRENLLLGYEKQARIMNTAFQRVIVDRGLRDGESMILEYLHFLPSHFKSEILHHPSVIPITLQITNETIYKERISERSFYSHLRSSGDRLLEQMDKYLILQEHLCSETKKFALPIFNIDDFDKGYDLILNHITQKISQLNNLKDYTLETATIEDILK